MTGVLGKRPLPPFPPLDPADLPLAKRDNCVDLCDDMLDIIINMPLLTAGDRCHVMQRVNKHWRACYCRYFKQRYNVEYAAFLAIYKKTLKVGLNEANDLPVGTLKAPWALLGAIRLKDSSHALFTILGDSAHRRAWTWPTLYHHRSAAFTAPKSVSLLARAMMYNIDLLVLLAVESGDDGLIRQCLSVGSPHPIGFIHAVLEAGTPEQLEYGLQILRMSNESAAEIRFIEYPHRVFYFHMHDERAVAMFTVLFGWHLRVHDGNCDIETLSNVPVYAHMAACHLLSDASLRRFEGRNVIADYIIKSEMRRRNMTLHYI